MSYQINIEKNIKTFSPSLFTLYIALFLCSILILIKMPLAFLPEWEVPQLLITIETKTIQRSEQEKIILKPLYQALSCANGIQEIRTLAKEGLCQIWIQLDWSVVFAKAENEIQAILDHFMSTLPEKTFYATLHKVSNQRIPLCLIAIESNNEEKEDFLERAALVQDLIIPQLNLIKGTGIIYTLGNKSPTIELSPKEKNQSPIISIEEAYLALLENRSYFPIGALNQGAKEIPIQYIPPYQTLEELKEFPLGSQKIPLKNFFDLSFSEGELNQFFLLDGKEQEVLFLFGNGENPISALKGISKAIKELNERLTPRYQLSIIQNNCKLLTTKLHELLNAFSIGILSTFIVLFLFTRSWLASFLSTLMIPIAFSLTIFFLGCMGKSINLMTLSGLAVSCGMIIDNNIIVMEMFIQKKEDSPWFQRAFFAIVGSTVSTLIIFLPLFLLKDLVGMLFKDLAITVTLTLLSSFLTALTLLPALMNNQRIYFNLEKKYRKEFRLKAIYYQQVHRLLPRRKGVIAFLLVIFFLPFFVFPFLKSSLFENPSIRNLTVELDFPSSFSPERLLENCQKIALDLKEKRISTHCQWGLSFRSQFNPALGSNGIELTLMEKKKKDQKKIEAYFQNSTYKEYYRCCYPTPTMIETALGNFEYRSEKIVPIKHPNLGSSQQEKENNPVEEKIQIVPREHYLIQQGILPKAILPHLNLLLNGGNGEVITLGNRAYPFHLQSKSYKTLTQLGKEKIKVGGKEYRIENLISFQIVPQEPARFSINDVRYQISRSDHEINSSSLYPSPLKKQIPLLLLMIFLSLLSLFVFLAILFNELKKALLTVMVIPLSFPFTLGVMALLKATINLESILSLLILSGSGINGVILLLQSEKSSLETATERLPSILMTTITTIIALIPFFGKNAIALPLCVGLILTNLITLFIVPVLLQEQSK